jgi:DNA-binding CsgD family transcriptional regulator
MIAVMMARAAVDLNPLALQGQRVLSDANESAFVVSVSRLDGWLDGLLTPAELKVLRLRIDGHAHDRVARIRGIAKRTVANHIANAYRKLGVSARLELLNKVLDGPLCQLPFTSPFQTYPTLVRGSRARALPGGSRHRAANEAGQKTA